MPRDLAWRAKPGVNPDAVFILILECGHSYAFHDLEAYGLNDYVNRFGRELDCVQCDPFLARASKRLAGHRLSGRYAGFYDLADRHRLLTQQKQQSVASPREMETDRDGESDLERPTKATIQDIARAVATAIHENTTRLIHDLLGRGEIRIQRPFANPDRPTTLAFGIECLFFSAFPLDVIIATEFGPHSDRIRSTLAVSLFELAQNMGLSRQYVTTSIVYGTPDSRSMATC